MPSETDVLQHIKQEVEAQGKTFKELPWLKQWCELARRYQGAELLEKERKIRIEIEESGYALDAQGQVIGLNLRNVRLPEYALLQDLRRLVWLSLRNHHELTDITFLTDIPHLIYLDLTYTQVEDLNPLINIHSLIELRITWTQVKDLNPLSNLHSLAGLFISFTEISDLSPLNNLYNLRRFYALNTPICNFAPLSNLYNLQELSLSGSEISDLNFLRNFNDLIFLGISHTKISDLNPLRSLNNLSTLFMEDTLIFDFTPLRDLINLTTLSLSSTLVNNLNNLKNLRNLTRLNISNTLVSNLTPLRGLSRLQSLNAANCKLVKLPRALLNLGLEIQWKDSFYSRKDAGINLYGNPLQSPPVEIVKQGREAILEWFKASEEEQRPLNEVKILLVGDGAAGKTSLVKCLFNKEFDPNEPQTHGILISHGKLNVNGTKVRARFWDFGGQEIMHATHQFFLSKRSLYLLVVDGRKDEKVEYWLKHIESFGGNSPVLVLLNKSDENSSFDLNRPFLQEKYPGIQGFYRISCKTKAGFAEFRKGLKQAILKVELLQTTWAQSWFEVKTQLEQIAEHFISYTRYQAICQHAGVSTKAAQDTLVGFLRDLGIILHFKELELFDTHVLDPKWVTEAVYRIINSEQLTASKGVLALDCLDEILGQGYAYPREKYRYIIELMKKFELCYSFDTRSALIPQMLPVQEPTFEFDYSKALKFILEYEFLPRSIMPRFIVKMHRDIKDELRWRSGVVLQDDDLQASAVVKSDDEAKRISISVLGTQRREYFAIVRKTLRTIHAGFEKLNVAELVPLPDYPEITEEYENLVGLEQMGEPFVTIGKLRKKYRVKTLLDGIEREEERDLQSLYAEKLERLQLAWAVETDVAAKFKLGQQIAEAKSDRAKL